VLFALEICVVVDYQDHEDQRQSYHHDIPLQSSFAMEELVHVDEDGHLDSDDYSQMVALFATVFASGDAVFHYEEP
jgi:hypothetical protein